MAAVEAASKGRREETATECAWCGGAFPARKVGSQVKRYCSDTCHRALDHEIRRWTSAAVAAGTLTGEMLRNGIPPRDLLKAAAYRKVAADRDEAKDLLDLLVLDLKNRGCSDALAGIPTKLRDRLLKWFRSHPRRV